MWHRMVHALCSWEMYTQLDACNTAQLIGKRDRCTPVTEPLVKEFVPLCLLRQRADRWADQQRSIRAATSAFSSSPAPSYDPLFYRMTITLTRLQLGVRVFIYVFCYSALSEVLVKLVVSQCSCLLWYLKVHCCVRIPIYLSLFWPRWTKSRPQILSPKKNWC